MNNFLLNLVLLFINQNPQFIGEKCNKSSGEGGYKYPLGSALLLKKVLWFYRTETLIIFNCLLLLMKVILSFWCLLISSEEQKIKINTVV